MQLLGRRIAPVLRSCATGVRKYLCTVLRDRLVALTISRTALFLRWHRLKKHRGRLNTRVKFEAQRRPYSVVVGGGQQAGANDMVVLARGQAWRPAAWQQVHWQEPRNYRFEGEQATTRVMRQTGRTGMGTLR